MVVTIKCTCGEIMELASDGINQALVSRIWELENQAKANNLFGGIFDKPKMASPDSQADVHQAPV